ncbi:Pex19 protein family-domain-containing protein [Apodospora peruviana]|uniref:Pex19 protein family-domain-containing protein n=1 Tax=Apodospora peruviana TaxID=516989 RepID=A0AAE0IK47_9PEZI|nr:Pex19 protein family-domain-containing protein [Apodospora peruviana]
MESKAGGDIGAARKEQDAADQQTTAAPITSVSSTGDKAEKIEDEGDDVPDPDEDDLDDLDDLLDEFSPLKVADSEKPQAAAAPSSAAAATAEEPKLPNIEDVLTDEDFTKQLQAGMADLLGEIESTPEMHAQFESIFRELGAAAAADPTAAPAAATFSSTTPPGAATGNSAAAEASFQETIRKTMERMQASGEQATAAATATAEGSDDFMAELLKQMQTGGGLEGEGNDEEFSKMLLGMMEQLTTKEILYEPMKELHEKFPGWLEKNKVKTPADDLKRYEEQQALVKEIVAKFEEPTYTDSNTSDREYIVDRMQKMQAAGSPPPDLVGDMPSAQDAMNVPDESCNPQ